MSKSPVRAADVVALHLVDAYHHHLHPYLFILHMLGDGEYVQVLCEPGHAVDEGMSLFVAVQDADEVVLILEVIHQPSLDRMLRNGLGGGNELIQHQAHGREVDKQPVLLVLLLCQFEGLLMMM